jgi:hypothetical protein
MSSPLKLQVPIIEYILKFQRRRHSIIGTCSFRGEDIQLLVLEVSEEKIFNYWYLKFQRRRHSITVLVLVVSEENIFNYWYL